VPRLNCPACEENNQTVKMVKETYKDSNNKKHDVYKCPDCRGAFIPKSIFGVT